MQTERINLLMQRFFDGTSTLEEREELARWVDAGLQSIDSQTIAPADGVLQEALEGAWLQHEPGVSMPEEVSARVLSSLFPAQAATRPMFRTRWAVAAILLVLAAGVWLWAGRQVAGRKAAGSDGSNGVVAVSAAKNYIRNIVLPDGSTVVLQAGSRLDLSAGFGTGNRELSLTGEAYFDVVQDATKPFVIHTRRLTTTVLGTAFNIRAWPDGNEESVSVKTGRVKVEEAEKLLGVLTGDQQIVYHRQGAVANERKVDVGALVSDWTKQDMVFEETRFDSIAAIVGRRYNVELSFQNKALGNCLVHAYFEGTEPLEKVLSVLCKVRGATYTRPNEHSVVINGKGCDGE